MSYSIRQANPGDLPRIEEIYAYARRFMASTGNPDQWKTNHPPRAQVEQDIASGQLYVITEEHQIHGVFFFSTENDSTYDIIYDGAWHDDAAYGVIHRIAGDGSGGIVKGAVDFAKARISYLRIDTHRDNRVMQHVLKKNGFRECGTIYLANGESRIAFDSIR